MGTNYEKNITTMRELFPDYADLIEKTPDVPWLETVRAENGRINLRVTDSARKTSLAYPEEDPAARGNIAERVVLHNQKGTILFGIGAGHGLATLLELREPKHSILIVEPVMHLMRVAFAEYDFSVAIKDGTLFFCPGKAEVEFNLAWLEGHKAIDGWNIIIDHVARMRAEYWSLMNDTMKIHQQTQGNIYTVEGHGLEIAKNEIDSLPAVIRHRGVKELVGLYANKPCIIVATGPSLARNIHMLKEVYENKTAIIIAVAQALRPLLGYGIRPDFICTVDFGMVNMSHLAGLMDEQVPLVAISKAYAPLLKAYAGPKFISASPLEGAVPGSLYALMTDCGTLMQGGSVLHMAFGLAACLGCNPFILIGADLAYESEDVSHFGQVDSMGKLQVHDGNIFWHIDDPRSTLGGKTIFMGEARYVEGYYGKDVLTNAGLASFITTLESYADQAAAAGVTVIDATEGGARKKHTRRMFLRQALDTHCKESINKSGVEPLLTLDPKGEERITQAIPLLETEVCNLRELARWAEEGMRHAKKSLKVWDKREVATLLAKNAMCTKKAYELAGKVLPMGYAMNATLRKMDSREFAITKEEEGHSIDDLKIREKGVKRNAILLAAARDNARELEAVYTHTLNTLRQHVAGVRPDPLDPTGETEPPSLDDATEYLEAHNWAHPLLEAERTGDERAFQIRDIARVMRDNDISEAKKLQQQDIDSKHNLLPLYLDLVEDSKELGRVGMYKEALAKIDEAIKLRPDLSEARWGRATLLHIMNRQEEALAEYEIVKTMGNELDRLRLDFEMGQVLLKIEGRRAEGKALILSVIEKDPAAYGHYREELEKLDT